MDKKLLCNKMYAKMAGIPEMLDVKAVLIENQPAFKNPTMGKIAALLFGYCIGNRKNKDIRVKYISPANKLKINEDKTLEIVKNSRNSADKYKLTKALAVKYTKMLLEDNPIWMKHLMSYKKKDDLCDAFLQGYHYLYFKI